MGQCGQNRQTSGRTGALSGLLGGMAWAQDRTNRTVGAGAGLAGASRSPKIKCVGAFSDLDL